MNAKDSFISYIEANRPIIYVDTFDFNAFDMTIKSIKDSFGAKICEYIDGLGMVDFKHKSVKLEIDAYNFLKQQLEPPFKEHKFIILRDFSEYLKDSKIVALLKTIALKAIKNDEYYATIFIVSSTRYIPAELEKLITIYEVPLPDESECERILNEFATAQNIKINSDVIRDLKGFLKGFSEFEIIQILNLAYQQSGSVKKTDIAFILKEKEQIIKKTGMLRIMNFDESMNDVGGLENLKEWVSKKAQIFNKISEAKEYGVNIPKGVLIVGIPGCGKSLTAKATANLFNYPLLQLDVGKLLGKYVGESEENMRKALSIAEAISPTVLWIDEIEKAFSGVGSGSGHEVTTRLFGYFLTWMQEKNSSVFVVATSNDISSLPPEFLRKGRFDEIFFVDFPNKDERRSIIKLHLEKSGKLHKNINLIELVDKTNQYTGADIQSVISQAIEKAFLAQKPILETEDIINEINSTKPMAVALKDKVDSLRKSLERLDVKNASRDF